MTNYRDTDRRTQAARREGLFIDNPALNDADFRTCDQCAHLQVCDIAKHTAIFLANNYKEDAQPFQYQDLAKVCNLFQLKTGERTRELAKQ